jgi:hypothetical protein
MLPIPVALVHLTIIDDGKTIVGRPRVKRQKMYYGKDAFQTLTAKVAKSLEGNLAFLVNHVGIGNENGVLLAPQTLSLMSIDSHSIATEDVIKTLKQLVRDGSSV